MAIQLSSLLPIKNPGDFKAHLACCNGTNEPLDVFVQDRTAWDEWNAWRSGKNEFNRPYIFSLIEFYPESDNWLFGGIYKVLSRNPENYNYSYKVESVADHEELVGRLTIRFKRPGRIRSIKLENYYDQMIVSELLKESYSGERFPGYESINHEFRTLEVIFHKQRPDWKAALENVKGVYAIFDQSNGKKYVGSAYGEAGVWSRWSAYIGTGHGWTDDLTKLIEANGIKYARKNFRFVLLEYRSARTDDHVLIERETFWKKALLSHSSHGYNKN